MEHFTTDTHLINLGCEVKSIHNIATGLYPSKYGLRNDGGWCQYVNDKMKSSPDDIFVTGDASESIVKYQNGISDIERVRKPLVNLLFCFYQIITGNVIGMAASGANVLGTHEAMNNFIKSKSVYESINAIVDNYKCVSVNPEGLLLKKGIWDYMTYGTSSMRSCRERGIFLKEFVKLSRQ